MQFFLRFFYNMLKIKHIQRSDEELLKQFIQTAEQEFLGQLYARYIPLVYGLCLKYLQQIEDAEDAVNNIYEEIYEKIHNYQVENFKTWIYSVAKNHCLQVLRKEKNKFIEEIDISVMDSDEFEHLIDVEDDKEKEEALNYCLGTLSEEQHQCIVHFFFNELSYADIVDKTGFALSKVKSYIQNGKRNLKNCILKFVKN